jgi:UDP-N-acetylmuramoylalanine--D-glutamate ligase
MTQLRGRRVTVMGLGRFGGGIAVARWLVEQGARVLVTDRDPESKLVESRRALAGLPINFVLGEHRERDFIETDLLVISPAVPPTNRYLQCALNAGVELTTEIRLFIERCPAQIIGVTGTKGKSTCTTLLGKMLATRYATHVGGNIGRSLLPELPRIETSHLVVLELSSFMLHHLGLAKWSPHVGVITMLSADHLDWHGSLEAYVSAKENILRFQHREDYAVLNVDDFGSAPLAKRALGQVRWFGGADLEPFELPLPGAHNQLNAQAAFAAASIFGIAREAAQEAIRKIDTLPHRLRCVHTADGIQWYDDSIATVAEAAIAALKSFPSKTVIQIVGGYDKGLPVSELCAQLTERAKAVLCIGATGEAIYRLLSAAHSQGSAAIYQCGDLETAVDTAAKIAVAGDVVLLSPAFASYDQFINFEERGDRFAQLARSAAPRP